MALQLRCECGREVTVPEGGGGAGVSCSCGRLVAVPAPPALGATGEPQPPESYRQAAEVLAEVERLQNEQPGWGRAVGVLAVSLLLYMGSARAEGAWDGLAILIPVLAFHELGQYVAMRGFGYRNLRMFFIPFFGAAVSGRHYNVAGWKKSLVALAGPVPGIVIGVPLGLAGLTAGAPKAVEVALVLLILNGFN